MRKVLMVLVLALCVCNVYAQTIKGKVVDEKSQPIAYATVLLLNKADSSFVKGVTSGDDGAFSLEEIVSKGILKVSALGYNTVFKNIGKDNIEIVVLAEERQNLAEVVVKGSRPQYQRKDGNLLTNVEGTVLAGSHNVMDVLLHVPGMVTTANGDLEVFGQGQPVIYINNRKVQSDSEVKQLTPSEIKSVELITNPGARYDASGKAVLNILTVKKKEGWQFQMGETLKQSELFSHSGDVKVGVKTGGLSLSANYSYNDYRNKHHQPSVKELNIEDITHTYDSQKERAKNKQMTHNWELSCDYEFTPNHIIGVEWDGNANKDIERRFTGFDYLRQYNIVRHLDIDNNYTNKISYNHANVFYNGHFSKQLEFDLNLDYVNNHNKYHQNTVEAEQTKETNTLNIGRGAIYIYSGNMSLEYSPCDVFKLTGGVDYYYIKNNSNLSAVSNNTSTLTSDFCNTETKYAVFVDAKMTLGKWNLSGGIRYEQVPSHYVDKIDDSKSRKVTDKHVFPALSVSYRQGDWYNGLSFSSRITRPTFRQLSNSSFYGNEYMYQQGNPLLKSAISHVLKWDVGYKFVNANVSYNYIHNYITTDFYMPESAPTHIVSSYRNYDKISCLRFNLSAQKKIGCWNPSLSMGLEQPFFTAEYMGESVKYNKMKVFVVTNQHVELPKGYMLSVYYYWCNGGLKDAVKIEPYQMLNVGLRKSFLKKKLSVSIDANDIFHTMKFKEVEKLSYLVFRQTEDYSLWNYSISVKYYLSPVKQKYRGKNSVQDEIQRL